ncbi:hypothetical protein CDL15_Pgr007814 [Punica granatum]|uniref:Uncharacterized protein n=1 Tax=Punica granatum TaxID=22663 RepID=A0A218XAQ5_PUNGR|nr:hypothetical protein CDL15_Pgr007814 [Punica granatum]PKI43425.1 hypothetical protein CRG98_036182 [Punica granatum]
MGFFRPALLLPWLLLLIVSASEDGAVAEAARPLSSFPSSSSKPRYAKILATLGIVCKCCNGSECTSTWNGSCSQLQCLPWKLS